MLIFCFLFVVWGREFRKYSQRIRSPKLAAMEFLFKRSIWVGIFLEIFLHEIPFPIEWQSCLRRAKFWGDPGRRSASPSEEARGSSLLSLPTQLASRGGSADPVSCSDTDSTGSRALPQHSPGLTIFDYQSHNKKSSSVESRGYGAEGIRPRAGLDTSLWGRKRAPPPSLSFPPHHVGVQPRPNSLAQQFVSRLQSEQGAHEGDWLVPLL